MSPFPFVWNNDVINGGRLTDLLLVEARLLRSHGRKWILFKNAWLTYRADKDSHALRRSSAQIRRERKMFCASRQEKEEGDEKWLTIMIKCYFNIDVSALLLWFAVCALAQDIRPNASHIMHGIQLIMLFVWTVVNLSKRPLKREREREKLVEDKCDSNWMLLQFWCYLSILIELEGRRKGRKKEFDLICSRCHVLSEISSRLESIIPTGKWRYPVILY